MSFILPSDCLDQAVADRIHHIISGLEFVYVGEVRLTSWLLDIIIMLKTETENMRWISSKCHCHLRGFLYKRGIVHQIKGSGEDLVSGFESVIVTPGDDTRISVIHRYLCPDPK